MDGLRKKTAAEMPASDMTLRDWFAGQALAGLLANHWADQLFQGTYTNAAPEAYAIADAMLAEREKERT